MRRLVATVTAIAFLTAGCATVFHGTSETIHVRSEVPETTFYAGAQQIGKGTSAVTTIEKKSLKKTTLRAEKPNCIAKTTPLMTSFDGITLLGILLDFGLISILVVDGAATGAWTHAARTDYILTPECPEGFSKADAAEHTERPAPSEPRNLPTVAQSPPQSPRAAQPTSHGELRIITDPEGVEVWLGAIRLGTTTKDGLRVVDIEPGTLSLTFRKEGYANVERTVRIEGSGEPATLFVHLATREK